MTDQETTKGNKLIAEFMGWTTPAVSDGEHFYNKDWSWLMPVFEKIMRMKIGDGRVYVEYPCARTFGMLGPEGEIMVQLEGFPLIRTKGLIEATYLAVIDFISWYNKNKTKIDERNSPVANVLVDGKEVGEMKPIEIPLYNAAKQPDEK